MPSSLRLFLFLCVFRTLNTFLIQSYFDPDEQWQTLEPAYCAVFRPDEGFDCPGFTWEWKRRFRESHQESSVLSSNLVIQSLRGPVRTYFSVLPTHLFYTFVRFVGLDTLPTSSWWVARGPMMLFAITVAAPTDWAVWHCAKIL